MSLLIPTLMTPPSPHRRESSPKSAPLRAVGAALRPHWGALAALAALALIGLATFDDYGVFYDEQLNQLNAIATIEYLLGDADAIPNALPFEHNKFYGMAFEAPLLLAQRAFDLTDSRSVHLFRHLCIHLFFLSGGLFCYFLAFRLFGNRLLATFSMLLLLAHPRLRAHSFFSSIDIPFLAMFVLTLFFARRAFKSNTLSAFALLGAATGALVDLRIMGTALLAAVLCMRALDFAFARNRTDRKRALLTAAVFALASALTTYGLMPYLWENPVGRSIEWWATLSDHPMKAYELFMGEVYRSDYFPSGYLPGWFLITTPSFALLMGIIGAGCVIGAAAGEQAYRNTTQRFNLMLAACFVLPVFAVIALDANIYAGWRHMFFLWAPFSLLAAFGLQWLLGAVGQRRLRGAVYAATGAGLGTAAVSMALLHPFQHIHFNFLVDRVTPERLNAQYEPRLAGDWAYPALRGLLDLRPSMTATVAHSQPAVRGLLMLTEAEQNRVSLIPRALAEFSLRREAPAAEERMLASGSIYANTLWAVVDEPDGNSLIGAYEQASAEAPVARGEWAIYLNREERVLIYAQDPSDQSWEDVHFYLFVYPENRTVLRDWERETGRANLSFDLHEHGAAFDGKRVAAVPLPSYEIAGIRTGQVGDAPWESVFPFMDFATLRAAFDAAATREPDARAEFNVYADGAARRLVYAKEPCSPSDASERFFLHIVPERMSDLPDDRRKYGFENRGFDFLLRGIAFDGKCVASVPLPDYTVDSVRTGQFISGEGEIWSAEFAVGQ